MTYRCPLLLVFVTLCFTCSVFGQSEINSYPERSSFGSAIDDQKILDFEGIAPNSGFRLFKQEGEFSTGGVTFRPGGGARFGPGHVTIIGGMHYAGPAFETTSGAKLAWSPPNQPGNAYLDITLPGGTTAVALDLWTVQPYTSPIEVIVNTSGGASQTVTINTPTRPAAAFVGFTSNSTITSLRFTPAKGQTGLVIDNFTFGRSARTADVKGPTVGSEAPRVSRPESTQPRSPATAPVQQALPRPSTVQESPAVSSGGTIAYVRGGTEIRTSSPDGSNDRRIWTHPSLTERMGLYELAWRPDGKELAFSTTHSATTSLYHADIYAIKPDGSGLRKLTNPPDHGELARFPKGSVNVTLRNIQPASTTPGTFIVYVAGAAEAQQVTIPPGEPKTVVFKSVADFGKQPQPVVVMFGPNRWFIEGPDVQAGRSVATSLTISGEGYEFLGAFRPVWRSDGSRVSFRNGHCVVSSVPSKATPGEYSFLQLFGGKNPGGACTWDWGPTADTADQLIYTENVTSDGSAIFRLKEGGTHPGTRLTNFSDSDYQVLYDLRWLPDGSGFLYSTVAKMHDSANIFRYDFATKKVTKVTDLRNEFAQTFSISPDGRSVVFDRCKDRQDWKTCDLWIASTSGGDMRLLVKNGVTPSWGK